MNIKIFYFKYLYYRQYSTTEMVVKPIAVMGRFQASDRLNLSANSKWGWIRSPFRSEAWSEPSLAYHPSYINPNTLDVRIFEACPNLSLTYIYPSSNHPNMVGCSDDCSDLNSEQFQCSDDCFEIRTRTILVRKHTWTYKNISQKVIKAQKIHLFKPRLCTL